MPNELLTGEPENLAQRLAVTCIDDNNRGPLIEEINNNDSDEDEPPSLSAAPQLSLMEQMLLESTKNKEPSVSKPEPSSSDTLKSAKKKKPKLGFKKGFLLSSSGTSISKKTKASQAKEEESRNIETVRVSTKKEDPLHLPEVQQTLSSWATPDLMEKIESNPKLRQALMQDPNFTKALEAIQRDPSQAKVIFQQNPQMASLLQEFCGLLGMHFTELGGGAQTSNVDEKEQRQVNEVLANPEVREALMDPDMKRIMQECGHPGRMQAYMSHPTYGPKLQTLIKAGLLQVAK